MTHEEKIKSLELTAIQEKAFSKLQKAFRECEKAGITFIGLEEFHYAFNGHNLESYRDYNIFHEELSDSEIDFRDLENITPSIMITEPYVNVSVALNVKT